MYVLDVIVLSRAAPAGTLSYRSAKAHAPGTLLSLDLRKQQTLGVVTACDPAIERKTELKLASYTLRGSRDTIAGTLPEAFMQAAERIATWHAVSLGSVLSVLLADLDTQTPPAFRIAEEGFKCASVEDTIDARAQRYRDAIAEHGSSLLVVPTLQEVAYWKTRLRKLPVTVLAPERSCRHWMIEQPSLVIIERAGSGSYVLPKRPHLDVRRVHEELARASGAALMLGDLPLPLELRPEPSVPLALHEPLSLFVHDARRPEDDQSDAPWQAIPDPVVERIRAAIAEGGKVALLGVRTGYAPAIVCRDCGQAVADERGRALTFSLEGGERIFRSADGTTRRPADLACSRCGSWNLLPLGIGVERIKEEAEKIFPGTPIAYLAPDVLTSTRKTSEAFAGIAEGGILIGTEAMLPYILRKYGTDGLSLGVIVSADSLLAFPLWRARERFVRLALFLTSLARDAVIVTRRPDDTALALLGEQSDASFFEEESMLRKALRYPPFATLIALTRQGAEAALARLDPVVMRAVDGTERLAPADTRTASGAISRTTVLTIPEGAWPDPALAARLASLPPSVRVRVDPEALW